MGKLKYFICLLLVAQLLGCAQLGVHRDKSGQFENKYNFEQGKSYAANVMAAAGIDARNDIRRPKGFNEISPNDGSSSSLIQTGLTAAAWGAMTGIGQSFSLLSIGKTRMESDYIHIFAWVPAKGISDEEANKKLTDIFKGALLKKYIAKGYIAYDGENNLYQTISAKLIPTYQSQRYSKDDTQFFFGGDNRCTHPNSKNAIGKCTITVLGNKKINGERNTDKQMVITKAPEFMGIGDSYFSYNKFPYSSYVEIKSTIYNSTPLFKWYMDISKELPGWIYIYLPQRWDRNNYQGYPNLPVLINKGKAHFFFKPEAKQ